jgi:hypothetical protein
MSKKTVFLKLCLVSVVVFGGCANMTFNAQMCQNIRLDPQATMPQECMKYSEEEAAKASIKPSEKIQSKESLEFNKE